MALQIRRGTDADRQGITPKAGEPIFTTDTKKLYIGDGATAGGIIVDTTSGISNVLEDTTPQLGGNLDLNNSSITGTGNINITGQISASSIDLKGSIFADDSTLLVDGVSGTIPASNLTGTATIDITGDVVGDVTGDVTGNVTGDVTGNVTGNTTGYHTGDVSGSIFANDSSLLIDSVDNVFTGNIRGGTTISDPNLEAEIAVNINSQENTSKLNLKRISTSDLSGNNTIQYGTISFGRDDSNGLKTTALIFARESEIRIGQNSAGTFATESVYITWKDQKLGLGRTSPTEQLDMTGNAKIDGFVQFGSFTTTERDGLTAANGMVIYNTTLNKFQGYENGAWANLI